MDAMFSLSSGPALPLITMIFIGSILALSAYFFFFRFTTVTVSNAPAVLTSLGIFGTFVGVAWGLSGFDTGNVEASIPALLNGLKTAFWSSIAGIGGAVAIKLKHLILVSRTDHDGAGHEGASVDDLASLLGEMNRSLAGDAQSTISSRLELIRQDTNDRLDALQRSFDEFLVNTAQSNSRALVDALREVTRDFNVKVNEQFGDNFKQLNEAMQAILVWQEAYRQQIAEMIDRQIDAAERMSSASESYRFLVERAEAFSGIAEQLGKLLPELDRRSEHVHEATSSLAEIAEYFRTWNFIAPGARSRSLDGQVERTDHSSEA